MYFNTGLSDILPTSIRNAPTPYMRYEMPVAPPSVTPGPAPYTLSHLIKWLKGKDPAHSYDWASYRHCLIAEYQTAQYAGGFLDPFTTARLHFQNKYGITRESEMTTYVASLPPWTYGAALDRAKKLEASWQSN